MNLAQLYQETFRARFYRLHPVRAAQLLYSKHVFSRTRVHDSLALLSNWGLVTADALQDFDRWRGLLEKCVTAVAAAQGEHGGISLDDGLVLYAAARTLRPRYVVETGVAAGVSTAFLAAALIDNGCGRLYSLELPPEDVAGIRQDDGALFGWPNAGIGWAVPEPIRAQIKDRHTLLLGDVRTQLPRLLADLGTIDIFFHDDLHTPDHMLWEYELVWERLRDGGLLISDDVNHAWLHFCSRYRLPSFARTNAQRLATARKVGAAQV